MKIKAFIALVVLLVVLVIWRVPFSVKELETSLSEQANKYGFQADIKSAKASAKGVITFDSVSLKDTLGNSVQLESIYIESSTGGLFDLKRMSSEGVPTFEGIHKAVKRVVLKGVKASWASGEGGLVSKAYCLLDRNELGYDLTAGLRESEVGPLHLDSLFAEGELTEDMLTFSKIASFLFGGAVDASALYRFEDGMLKLAASGNNIALNKILATEKVQGDVSMEFSLDSTTLDYLTEPERLSGKGKLVVTDFYEDKSPLFRTAYNKLDMVGIDSLWFDSLSFPFVLDNGLIKTDSLRAVNALYALEAAGRYRLKNNHFNFTVTGIFDEKMKEKVKPVIWDALILRDDSLRTFSGDVKGVPEDYSVSVDSRLFSRGINSFFRNIFQ